MLADDKGGGGVEPDATGSYYIVSMFLDVPFFLLNKLITKSLEYYVIVDLLYVSFLRPIVILSSQRILQKSLEQKTL